MDDKTILALFQCRDERALAECGRKYGELCRRTALNILGNAEDAEECVNDTYAALWQSIPPACPQSLAAYACGVARNLAHKRYEHDHAARRRTNYAVSLDELAESLPDTSAEGGHLAEALNGFLATLTPRERRAFVRRYWLGESIADVARDGGMSVAATKSLLHRLRGRLKKYLEKEGISI